MYATGGLWTEQDCDCASTQQWCIFHLLDDYNRVQGTHTNLNVKLVCVFMYFLKLIFLKQRIYQRKFHPRPRLLHMRPRPRLQFQCSG